MTSIRRSLIVYFLLLVTAALAAVSWLVYRTTADTLHARQRDSRRLIKTQYRDRVDEVHVALDKRLLRQAQAIANMSRSMSLHYEPLHLLGTMTAAVLPQGEQAVRFWLAASGMNPRLAFELHRLRPTVIHAESVEDIIPDPDPGQPREYFQTYRATGERLQRSEGLTGCVMRLDRATINTAEPLKEWYDEIEIRPGERVRRVTLKANVRGFGASTLPFAPYPIRFFTPGKGPPRAGGRQAGPQTFEFPTFFIQYASDLTGVRSKEGVLRADRDRALEQLDAEVESSLRDLRAKLLWTALATLAALWAGGYVLVRLGLAPLQNLSEGVRRVTPANFKLGVDPRELPQELQPIAARLAESLDQLKKAFAREKQAAADISHELRTPLAALLTTLEVALKKPRSSDYYQEVLEEARLSGQQMQHLVERLLALARLDAGAVALRPRTVDVADLAVQCADLVRPLARARGLALRVHADAPQPIEADPDKLREVLTNLLHNAIEYNRPDGSIDLAVRRANGHVHLRVRDTGIGITPEAKAHIFERFYRADPSRHADAPHAGLGLAIVKSYVDLMGGRISVESDAGGSTFHVELPAPAGRSEPERQRGVG